MLVLGSRLVPPKVFLLHDVDVLELEELRPCAPIALSGAYELGVADASILEELVECTDTPATIDERRRVLRRMLARDFAACITVRRGGRLVAYLCTFERSYVLTYDDYGPKTLRFALEQNAIFLGNAFIRPEYRMKGLFPHMLRYCVERHAAGTHFFGHLDADNVHSFASHRRVGFVPRLTVTCLGIGPTCFFFQRAFGTRRRTRVDQRLALRLIERGGVLSLLSEG